MASPTNITQVIALSNEIQNAVNDFYNMMIYANKFVNSANALADDPQFSIASQAFKTWGSNVLSQVTTFVQNTTNPPPW